MHPILAEQFVGQYQRELRTVAARQRLVKAHTPPSSGQSWWLSGLRRTQIALVSARGALTFANGGLPVQLREEITTTPSA